MADDVLLNKAAMVERCLARIRAEYLGHESELETDFTRQDSMILNLQRACEDLSMPILRSILEHHVEDFSAFTHTLIHAA